MLMGEGSAFLKCCTLKRFTSVTFPLVWNTILFQCYLWTMERNLDTDTEYQEASEEPETVKTKVEKVKEKRRHSLSTTLNFLHLNWKLFYFKILQSLSINYIPLIMYSTLLFQCSFYTKYSKCFGTLFLVLWLCTVHLYFNVHLDKVYCQAQLTWG